MNKFAYCLLLIAYCLIFSVYDARGQDYFKSPSGIDDYPLNGSGVFINWNSSGSKKHKKHHLYWWIDSQAPLVTSPKYRHHPVNEDDGCSANTNIADSKSRYSDVVPCFDAEKVFGQDPSLVDDITSLDLSKFNVTNQISVRYYHKPGGCVTSSNEWDWGTLETFPTIYPVFPGPQLEETSELSMTCQDGSYVINLTVPADVTNGYKANRLVCQVNPVNGASYTIIKEVTNYNYKDKGDVTFTIEDKMPGGLGGNIICYGAYYHESTQCLSRGINSVITILPYQEYSLNPPVPKELNHTQCFSTDTRLVEVDNIHDYDGAYWYDEALGTKWYFLR